MAASAMHAGTNTAQANSCIDQAPNISPIRQANDNEASDHTIRRMTSGRIGASVAPARGASNHRRP